jgi:hypothetical protein
MGVGVVGRNEVVDDYTANSVRALTRYFPPVLVNGLALNGVFAISPVVGSCEVICSLWEQGPGSRC